MYRGWRITAGMVLAMLAAPAVAGGGPGAVRKQIEASMLLTGEIEIDAGGRVVSHRVDQVEKVPAAVAGLLAQAIPQWTFEPVVVGGKPVPARSRMRVRVVARERDDGSFAITFRDADFPGDAPAPGTYPSGQKMVQPVYPASALRAGASAAVFVVAKIGPDGKVEDAVAEQVNLPFVASERVMGDARKLFAAVSVQAAKRSTFNPPTVGEDVGKSTSVRVPYVFQVDHGAQIDRPYGQWVSYVPGPYQPAPWRVGELTRGAPDLMAAGDAAQPLSDDGGLRLLTRLGDGG